MILIVLIMKSIKMLDNYIFYDSTKNIERIHVFIEEYLSFRSEEFYRYFESIETSIRNNRNAEDTQYYKQCLSHQNTLKKIIRQFHHTTNFVPARYRSLKEFTKISSNIKNTLIDIKSFHEKSLYKQQLIANYLIGIINDLIFMFETVIQMSQQKDAKELLPIIISIFAVLISLFSFVNQLFDSSNEEILRKINAQQTQIEMLMQRTRPADKYSK